MFKENLPVDDAAKLEMLNAMLEKSGTESVEKGLERRSRDQVPTAFEIQQARRAGRTQGRKGCKAVRINMAFYPEVYEYIKTMSRCTGKSITQFTNDVFKKSMEDNAKLYNMVRVFSNSMK